MNTVRASHHRRVFEFPRAPLQRLRQPLQVLRNQRRRLHDQQGLRRVDYIIRSQTVVEPARMRADDFRHRRSEGNDVMAHLGLDLINSLHIEVRPLTDRFGRVLGHQARFRQRLGSGDFNRQPGAKPVLIAPDAAHVRAGITRNQGAFPPVRLWKSEIRTPG